MLSLLDRDGKLSAIVLAKLTRSRGGHRLKEDEIIENVVLPAAIGHGWMPSTYSNVCTSPSSWQMAAGPQMLGYLGRYTLGGLKI